MWVWLLTPTLFSLRFFIINRSRFRFLLHPVVYTIHVPNWLSVRSAFGDILTFVDTRWYTLKFDSSTVKGRFKFVEERSRTFLFAQYVEEICACTKYFADATELPIRRCFVHKTQYKQLVHDKNTTRKRKTILG